MRSSLLELVIVTELQAAETYPSLDLAKARYSNISRLPMVEKENVIIRINPSSFIACEKKKMDIMMKIKFTVNMYTKILNYIFAI
jgi:hypothetical protein